MASQTHALDAALDSFDTVYLEYSALYRSAIIARASDPRYSGQVIGDPASFAVLLPPEGSSRAENITRFEWIVWWQRPDYWRDEIVWPDGTRAVNLITPVDATSRLHGPGSSSLAHWPKGMRSAGKVAFSKPLLDSRLRELPLPAPRALTQGWILSAFGEIEFVGRAALKVEARRTEESAHFFMDVADTFDLIVDQERGVILRCVAMVRGVEAAVIEARKVRFDDQLPASIFDFEP